MQFDIKAQKHYCVKLFIIAVVVSTLLALYNSLRFSAFFKNRQRTQLAKFNFSTGNYCTKHEIFQAAS